MQRNRSRRSAAGAYGAPPPAPSLTDTPTCRHFGTCGGCSQLTTPIAEQLHEKVAEIESLLLPFLGELRVESHLPRETPQHHRTKLLYPVRKDHQGLPILGIYRRASHDVVRIQECKTQDESLTQLGIAAEKVMRDLKLEPFDEKDGSGFVRAFHARLAAGTGEMLMGVVTSAGLFPQGQLLADRLFEAAAALRSEGCMCRPVGVVRSISERPDAFLLGDRHVPLRGRDYLEDSQDGIAFRISFGSFYQVHRAATVALYRPALRMCGDVKDQRVVDGYGGIGTFGLRFAKAGAAAVEIIEDNPTACRDAEHNAKKNGMPQIRVIKSRFATAEFAPGPDLLVVDPPRSGLQVEGVARVLAARPKRLLCVACSATSLAADLAGLTAGGYRLTAVRLCDMFPHTEHVEVLALLERGV